jgi:hypothetical protein
MAMGKLHSNVWMSEDGIEGCTGREVEQGRHRIYTMVARTRHPFRPPPVQAATCSSRQRRAANNDRRHDGACAPERLDRINHAAHTTSHPQEIGASVPACNERD